MKRRQRTVNLHEIDSTIRTIIAEGFDPDTGEVFGVMEGHTMQARLDELGMDREDKIKHCALFMREHDIMGEAIKKEEDRLSKRRKQHEAKAAWLKTWIEETCTLKEKFESPEVRVSFRKSTRIEIRTEEDVPKELWVYPPAPARTLDKKGAKKWIKDKHDVPPGINEVIGKNLQVK